jgi:hypothetical protein
MDLSILLAVAVALLTGACAYLLFNDMPKLGGNKAAARRRR